MCCMKGTLRTMIVTVASNVPKYITVVEENIGCRRYQKAVEGLASRALMAVCNG